jgi:branched-chain amino acid transport system ATP-binding protein
VLQVERISVYYKDIRALREVSLSVSEGEIVALLGPNAAGKSTTLRAISALHKARTGRILWEGMEIQSFNPNQIVELGIIQVPEGRGLFSTLTVRENLELGAYSSQARRFLKENLEQVYTLFPRLRDRVGQVAGSLSGGEQQMCAIARGLMGKPRLLMVDEMSLGLAPRVVKQMFTTVKQIAESGLTLLLVEQQIHRAMQVATYAFVLENGTTVLSGKTSELVRHEHIKRVYLGI